MEDKTLGRRYRLIEKIGDGGMAMVYTAQDEVLGRTVAVKIMHAQYASDPNWTARFRQEAQAAANIQSPYIVNIYDWGRDEDTYYIAMEYVRGIDLKRGIEQRGAIDPRKVAEIGAQVCAALSVAHGYDIIHRDIKPHNIMVQPDGNIKVMDFGIARAGNSSMTQTGSVLGTAHYVSPEQAQGLQLTASTDLYSLGVVLYEAATGKLPFDAPDAVSVALKQVNEQPIPPRRINPAIEPALESIILKAMAKRPQDRFASADEMRTALNAYLSGRPISFAGPAPASSRPVSAAAVPAPADRTSVLPSVGNAPVDPDWSDERVVGAPIRQAVPDKRPVWPWVAAGAAILIIIAVGIALASGLLGGKGVAVPDVIGVPLEEAKLTIVSEGFEVGEITEEYSKDIEAGSVMKQDPMAPATAAEGSKINLVVSLGTDMGVVPDVTGKTETEAFKILKDAGYDPQPAPSEYSAEVEAGLVISQDPEAGTDLEKGTIVHYVVSKGAEQGDIPDVVGETEAAAKQILTDAGFLVTVKQEYVDGTDQGKVASQSPSAGASMKKGGTVTIVVSKGAATIGVPDVIGMSESAARAELERQGFKVTVQYEPHANSMTVLEQNPSPGTEAKRGATIQLLVDKGTE